MTEAQSARAEIVRANPTTGELTSTQHEVGTSAAIAKARAEVEAPYTIARHYPRSWIDVRTRLLAECERPAFAKAAVFRKPQGGHYEKNEWVHDFVEGLSVRFSEAALVRAGNITAGAEILFDDELKRVFRVFAVDLETNAILSDAVTVEKTIERSPKRAGDRFVISSRKNSKGEEVCLCECTPDELVLKGNNEKSKARRNLILALIPADIRDECLAACKVSRERSITEDPNAERKALADGFAEIGVYPRDIETYMGHALEQCAPAELELLRGLFAAIRDGFATWPELVAEKEKPETEQVKTTKGKALATELKAKEAARKKREAEAAKGKSK
jgi:hypothetical protein